MNNLTANNYITHLERSIDDSLGKIKSRSKKEFLSPHTSPHQIENYNYRSQVENYSYELLPHNLGWQLHQEFSYSPENNFYASNSYQKSAGVLKESTVILDFMFKGNREFDFKI